MACELVEVARERLLLVLRTSAECRGFLLGGGAGWSCSSSEETRLITGSSAEAVCAVSGDITAALVVGPAAVGFVRGPKVPAKSRSNLLRRSHTCCRRLGHS